MMFNQYPYINVNDLNLDYILSQIKVMMNEVTNFVSINAIKYADPIQWDITRQYEKNTVVIDPVTGTAYISVAPVPAGVALTRPEYWTVVFDLGSFVTRAAQNFTSRYEQETTLTATFPTNTGEWLVWGDVLYKAKTNITAGDTYVVDGNIEHFTIEDLYNAYLNTIASILAMVGDLADLTTSDTSSIVNAINSVVSDFDNKIGDLDNLNTTDKDSVVDAINEVLANVGNLSNLPTADQTNVVNSIIEVVNTINANKLSTPYVNVKDYGATGNYTDDTQAFIDAIAAATALNKNTVYVPKGHYLISSPLELFHVTLLGDQNSILCPYGNMEYMIKLDNESNLSHIRIVHDHGFTPDYDIYVSGHKTIIDNCLIQNYKYGIKIGDVSGGVTTRPVYPIIINTSLEGRTNPNGYAIYARSFSNAMIVNCQILGESSGTQPYGGIFLRSGDTILMSNVNISNHGQALRIETPTNESIFSVYCTNCLFDNARETLSGVSIPSCEIINGSASKMTDFKFTNCWFGYSLNSDGCRALGSSGHNIDCLEFINCDFSINGNNGLTLNYVQNLKVIGCTLTGNHYCGMQVGQGVGNAIILGNRIGLTSRGTNDHGIKIDTNSLSVIMIVFNVLYGNTTDPIQGDASNYNVTGNMPSSVNNIATGTVRYSGGTLQYWNGSAWTNIS